MLPLNNSLDLIKALLLYFNKCCSLGTVVEKLTWHTSNYITHTRLGSSLAKTLIEDIQKTKTFHTFKNSLFLHNHKH